MAALASATRTANGAPALSSTSDAVLDAFHAIDAYTTAPEVARLLDAAWAADPARTLRVVWYVRSIHDGKGEREAFYRAFAWLLEVHPRTALANLRQLVAPVCAKGGGAHGYWKDLLNLVGLAVGGELTTRKESLKFEFLHHFTPRGTRTLPEEERKAVRSEDAARRYAVLAGRLEDNTFRALYIAVARLFAEGIAKDLATLQEIEKSGNPYDRIALSKKISLAGKWAPTPGGSHDRATNLSTAISALLVHNRAFPSTDIPAAIRAVGAQAASADAEQSHVLRSFLQRWVLRPLRAQLACPEPLMSARRWSEINYGRVPGVCMKRNTERFFQRDPDRFQEYLISVEQGKRSIASATLLPHQLVAEAVAATTLGRKDTKDAKYPKLAAAKKELAALKARVVQAQWNALVDRMRESGRLDNAIAICDVSGSMGSYDGPYALDADQPIFAAIAFSLLLASLAKPPFDAGFITFSEHPEFVRLDLAAQKPLGELALDMVGADWSMNTDFAAVFLKLLLPLAKARAVPREEMIKRLFVFSDMQFDEAQDEGSWETNYDVVARAYEEAGYEVPEIVFWDLSMGTPRTVEVEATRKGVALMNGFSAGLMKVFLGEEEKLEEEDGWVNVEQDFNPVTVMNKALGKRSFDSLVVVD
ncbi:hypothetical protein HDZ31DRAFT_40224 [Schizophyllum fasciatum]